MSAEDYLVFGENRATIKEEVLIENSSMNSQVQGQGSSHGHHPHHHPHQAKSSAEAREKGTFWPERPTKADPSLAAAGVKANTVLTNLQRGNIPTMQTIVMEPIVASLHQRAGMGELKPDEMSPALVNDRDHRHRTPLLWSAFYGQTPTVTLLLMNGADVNAEGDENETALHLASTSGHHDVVRVLLNHGAKVDALDENGCTPLMFASMNNHPHAVNELIQAGADAMCKNINGDTAISLALKKKSVQAQAVLEQHLLAYMRDVLGMG